MEENIKSILAKGIIVDVLIIAHTDVMSI